MVTAVPGNVLFYGDNLDVLRRYGATETVDLVYLDPPFNSNASYNVLFGHADGTQAAAQIKAFDDTWRWDQTAAAAFEETVTAGGQVAQALMAFQTLLGPSTMLAYLAMMAPRLVELRRVLKSSGSLYLHCDPTASHYLKLLLDAAFGPSSFRNEIVWKRTTSHSSAKRYAPVHDTLLCYAKGDKPTWNQPREPYEQAYLDKYYKYDDGDGRLYWRADLCAAGVRRGSSGQPWRGIDPAAKGMHWKFTIERLDALDAEGRIYWPPKGTMPQYKRYRDELKGRAVSDMWTTIDRINPVGKERLGYPTQKPLALLERIIAASSNPGDVVLDPFCGCGTTIAAAETLGRRWIGIDVTYLAISLIKSRLTAAGASDYTVLGEPTTADDAGQLAQDDPYQFQWWALGLIGARPAEGKKGADKGIDGRLFFFDEGADKPKQLIASVKAGKVQVSHVRDLVGVLDREDAQLGALVSFHDPTGPMREEAASAGFYKSPWGSHPRVQLLTVADLLAGKRIDMPAGGAHATQVALPPTPEQAVHPDQLSLGGPGE